MVGRIWDVGNARFIDPGALVERLVAARFVLLGEHHDNPDHHRLQAWVLQELITAGRRPAVGFEMFSLDDAPALERHLASHPADAAGLGEAVGWSKSGWPPWTLYQPIADAALAAQLPIVAANLDRATTQTLLRRGPAGLDPALAARLGLDRPPPPAVLAEMTAEIRASHCHIPIAHDVVDRMIAVQRARDAQMADRLAAAATRGGGVLIAGVGHVRTDRGVPAFLAQLAPGARAASLAFLEVQPDATRPEDYANSFGRATLLVDYVWFTPRADDQDPCEKYRRPLERLQRQPTE
jgi:uncharacterized iron-regulated protein